MDNSLINDPRVEFFCTIHNGDERIGAFTAEMRIPIKGEMPKQEFYDVLEKSIFNLKIEIMSKLHKQ